MKIIEVSLILALALLIFYIIKKCLEWIPGILLGMIYLIATLIENNKSYSSGYKVKRKKLNKEELKKMSSNCIIGTASSGKCEDYSFLYNKLNPKQVVSREEILKTMEKLPVGYPYEEDNKISLDQYLDVLKEIQVIISPIYVREHGREKIEIEELSLRHKNLMCVILTYMSDGIENNISKIYHELYDFIEEIKWYRWNDHENLNYIEVILIGMVINTIQFKLERKGWK